MWCGNFHPAGLALGRFGASRWCDQDFPPCSPARATQRHTANPRRQQQRTKWQTVATATTGAWLKDRLRQLVQLRALLKRMLVSCTFTWVHSNITGITFNTRGWSCHAFLFESRHTRTQNLVGRHLVGPAWFTHASERRSLMPLVHRNVRPNSFCVVRLPSTSL